MMAEYVFKQKLEKEVTSSRDHLKYNKVKVAYIHWVKDKS